MEHCFVILRTNHLRQYSITCFALALLVSVHLSSSFSEIVCYLCFDHLPATYSLSRSDEYNEFSSEKYIDQKGTVFVCAVVQSWRILLQKCFSTCTRSHLIASCFHIALTLMKEIGAASKDKLGEDYVLKKAPEDKHEDPIEPEENKKVLLRLQINVLIKDTTFC